MNSSTKRYAYQKSRKRKKPTAEKIKQNESLVHQLYVAHNKLLPVICTLMSENSNQINNSYYLTKNQIEDAVWASKVTNEFCKRISHFDDTVNVRTSDWDFSNAIPDSRGKVFIDTSTLFHLLDLNKTLAYLIETYGHDKNFAYTNIDFNQDTDKSDCKSTNSDVAESVRKYLVKLSEPLFYENFFNNYQRFFGDKNSKDFIVMSSQNFEANRSKSRSYTYSTKDVNADASTTSVVTTESVTSYEPDDTQITDVYGARDVIYNCISDLTRVKAFLETERTDNGMTTGYDEKSVSRLGSSRSRMTYNSGGVAIGSNGCCCDNCLNGGTTADGGDETIICIKGKNDEEDIQIVVKQNNCCRCNKNPQPPPAPLPIKQSYVQTESRILHNKDSEESIVCSESSTEAVEYSGFLDEPPTDCSEVLFNQPNNLCLTTDTGEELMLSFTLKPLNKHRSRSNIRQISRIKTRSAVRNDDPYRSTTNASPSKSKTRSGSLSFSPSKVLKRSRSKNISSSNAAIAPSSRTGSRSRSKNFSSRNMYFTTILPERDISRGRSIDDIPANSRSRSSKRFSKNLYSSEALPQNNPNVYYADAIIPLTRAKMCSSLEFDVNMVHTDVRRTEFLEFNKIGLKNMMRASRPARCSRKNIINEKPKNYVPYTASLRSLPLDENDMSIIQQSLQMNVQKVKNSTDIRQSYNGRSVYYYGIKNKEQAERLPWTITN